MRATVIYESMYGNTRHIAEAIAEGLDGEAINLLPVGAAITDRPATAQILVIGAPTHVRGLSRQATRNAAITAGLKQDSGLDVQPGAEGPGVRDWLANVVGRGRYAVAFDTRVRGKLTGRASRSIAKALARHGFVSLADPESFFVTKGNVLEPGEDDRAREWGRRLAKRFADISNERRTAQPGQGPVVRQDKGTVPRSEATGE